MPTTAHILETALLLLVAFLVGCVIGYAARRLLAPKAESAAAAANEVPTTDAAPQLVVAPTIAPVSRGPTPAQRLARAAAGSAAMPKDAERAIDEPPVATPVEIAGMRAARVAGHATSGREVGPPLTELPAATAVATVDAASTDGREEPAINVPVSDGLADEVRAKEPLEEIPPVELEAPVPPVEAEHLPEIDEAAHVVEGRVAPAREAVQVGERATETVPDAPLAAAIETAKEPEGEPKVRPADEPPADLVEQTEPAEDTEAAAMRAIEGDWTPRAAVAPRQPAPEPDLAPAEMEAAMRSARRAVATATAAVDAAIVDTKAKPTERSGAPPSALEFETAETDAAVASFLEGSDTVAASDELSFEPLRPVGGFGRPESLAAPRDGGKDNLRQIKGITTDLEHALNRLGIFHLDQVATWDQKAVVWLDHHLSLRGRIGREKWVDQAKALSGGASPRANQARH